ncbi:putative ENTH domain, clathrin interactor EPSIN 1 [Helianthus debilis subsp. tardiflorus]
MDFMKVIDQTVREIKREVNLKVLKVPEIEQKVLDATDDEPWGPHGTALAEIAQATKKFSECQMVMNVLWTRLTETDRNWRLVYKALAVIEYLVANGSERAVDDIIEHTFQISSLSSFEYIEPNGKDSGINVRKKVENIVSLLNDKDKIQAARNKAIANRDKYVGLSSTGIMFRSGSAPSQSSRSNQYDGFRSSRDGETFRDQSNEDRFEPGKYKPRKEVGSGSSKKGSSRYGSSVQDSSATNTSKPSTKNAADKYSSIPPQTSSAPTNNNDDDDFDDFDPRGTSTTKAVSGSSPHVDLFEQSLIGDLLDAPTSVPKLNFNGNSKSEEVDLFADAAFVSAPTNPKIDLFASPPASSAAPPVVDFFASPPASSAVSPAVDFFAAPVQVEPEVKPVESKTMSTQADPFDPFVAVRMNNFDNSDFFGSFSSHTGSESTEPTQVFMDSGNPNNQNHKTSAASTHSLKKDGFQVKSGVWADSLSRGLIDLNISGPKKVDLTDVGIVGGLSVGIEEKDKGLPNSLYMGRAMGTGSGLGKSTGFTTSATTDMDDFFSSLSGPQNQYGSFQK